MSGKKKKKNHNLQASADKHTPCRERKAGLIWLLNVTSAKGPHRHVLDKDRQIRRQRLRANHRASANYRLAADERDR